MIKKNKWETPKLTAFTHCEFHDAARDAISGGDAGDTIHIKKIRPSVKHLKNLIKYFWVFENSSPITLCHKLLPVNNIDIIFNLLSPMIFEKNGITYEPPGIGFFRGLTNQYILMKQQGPILTIGVSFFPSGFYPFFGIPVSEFRNEAVGLHAILKNSVGDIEARLKDTETISAKIELLEGFFLERLYGSAPLDLDAYKLLSLFHSTNLGVNDYCARNGVHPRTIERLFNKYIGATPKLFSRLSRFQVLLNDLISRRESSLTALAYEFGYYDQSHFIKEFRSFTGSPPSMFLKENRSIKQLIR